MRDIVISPETIQDIRRLCDVYRHSACYCEHLSPKQRELRPCPACTVKKVLKAIEPEEDNAKTTPPTA